MMTVLRFLAATNSMYREESIQYLRKRETDLKCRSSMCAYFKYMEYDYGFKGHQEEREQ